MRDYPIEKTRDIGIIAHISRRGGSTRWTRRRSLKPLGFNISATGNSRSPTPSRVNVCGSNN